MQHKIKVGLVQINNSFSGQAYFPYSVGILQAYCKRYLKNYDQFEFLPFIYSRIALSDILARLELADIVCFSVYVWNAQFSKKAAELLKKRNPAITVVFGGPHVPSRDTEKFLRENPYIDIVCHDEGEGTFLKVLENYNARTWADIQLKLQGSTGKDQNRSFTLTHHGYDSFHRLSGGIFDPMITGNTQISWSLCELTTAVLLAAHIVTGAVTIKAVVSFNIERLHKEIDWFSK